MSCNRIQDMEFWILEYALFTFILLKHEVFI